MDDREPVGKTFLKKNRLGESGGKSPTQSAPVDPPAIRSRRDSVAGDLRPALYVAGTVIWSVDIGHHKICRSWSGRFCTKSFNPLKFFEAIQHPG